MSDWFPGNDEAFFRAVLREEVLQSAMIPLGLDIGQTYSDAGMYNAGLQISKTAWTLRKLPREEKTVTVHFEMRQRGLLRLDVEIYPYEGSIKDKPRRDHQLRRPLDVKAALLDLTRRRFLAPDFESRCGATDAYCRAAHLTDACTAVKFERQIDQGCSPSECGAAIHDVIMEATPVVDDLVATYSRLLDRV